MSPETKQRSQLPIVHYLEVKQRIEQKQGEFISIQKAFLMT
jgi:hypothetical protein